MTLEAPYSVILSLGGAETDLTAKLIAVSELTRKTERDGRMPGIIYFDNVQIEIPYQGFESIFSPAALALYPRLIIEIKLGAKSLFKGIIDLESVRYTAGLTVIFTALNIISVIDRTRFPAAWESYDLVTAWDESFTTGSVNQVQFVPEQRVGTTPFYGKLFIQPLPTWNTQIPFRAGDFIIHPDFPSFLYQIINAKIVFTPNANFYELTLDRPYFDSDYVPGQSGPIYNSVSMLKRELLGRDIYEFAFNPDQDAVFTLEPGAVDAKAVAEAIFAQVEVWPVNSDFIGLLPLTLATVIASIQSPVDILLRIMTAAGALLYVNAAGEVSAKLVTNLIDQNQPAPPELESKHLLQAERLFSSDKRVDAVLLRNSWRGETDEIELEVQEALSPAARRNVLTQNVTVPPAELADLALNLLKLYGLRREQLKITTPLAAPLLPAQDYPELEQVADLDLFSPLKAPYITGTLTGWLSELRISLETLQADITLTSIEGNLPQGATNQDLIL